MRSQSLATDVAETIRIRLAAYRISGSELARQLGVSQMYVQRRLAGEVAFSLDDVESISEVLATPIPELLPARDAA